MRTLVLLLTACATTWLASAPLVRAENAPTTRPAPKPLPPLDAKNSIEASIPNAPATWRVFKGWKEQQLTGGVARSWVVPPAPTNAAEPIKTFTVSVLSGGKVDATVEAFADLNKQALAQRDPDVTFIRNEPIDFAGGKGWVLVYNTTQTGTVRDENGNERRVKSPVRSQRMMSVRAGHSATLTFTCDPDSFDRVLRNVDRVNASFAWKE